MVSLSYLTDHNIGPRTLLKSYCTYLKCQAGKYGKGPNYFLLNGKTEVSIGNNAVIENHGSFSFGIKNYSKESKSQPGFVPSTVAGSIYLKDNSKLVIDGAVFIGSNVALEVGKQAVLELDDVNINCNSIIMCSNHIKIGKGTIISFDVVILDSDRHQIVQDGFEMSKPIVIGSHVWVGFRAQILKGVTIGSGSIVAAGSVVARDVPENSLVAGSPAKVIKTDVRWEQ